MIAIKIAILTMKTGWYFPYASKLQEKLKNLGHTASIFQDHKDISNEYNLLFMLSYFHIVDKTFLDKHKHNIVIHASDLPKGRGWAPVFWQILEGKNRVPITLFEANEEADAGPFYYKDYLEFTGDELNKEIREILANKMEDMCLRFMKNIDNLHPVKQVGIPSEYLRRTPKDSELDINRSIKEQFNLGDYNNSNFVFACFHCTSHMINFGYVDYFQSI